MILTYTIHIYILIVAGDLFYLILAYEIPIFLSRWDICNIKIAYCIMLGFLQKLNITKKILINLNNKKTKILCFKVK